MSSQIVNVEWKSKNFWQNKVSKIRVIEIRQSKIRGSEIRVSEIRISSNHRELHGAIFSGVREALLLIPFRLWRGRCERSGGLRTEILNNNHFWNWSSWFFVSGLQFMWFYCCGRSSSRIWSVGVPQSGREAGKIDRTSLWSGCSELRPRKRNLVELDTRTICQTAKMSHM